jgi:NitT/TauT family transport system substrate-binding protein
MRRKISLIFVFMLSLALVLSGCSTGAKPSDNAGQGNQPAAAAGNLKAIVGYWGGTCEAPIYVAYENGFFKQAGLDVQLLKITSDVKLLLANNELDAYQLTPDQFKPIEQGLEVKIIDSVHIGCIQGAASKKSGIKSVADLEGKKVAAAVGSIPQIQISSQMVKLGKDPKKVNWVTYPNNQMEDALNKGEIDAFAAYDPFPEIAIQNGNTRFYSNTYDEGLKEYLCCFLGMNTKTLQKNPEIGKRLVKAYDLACQYLEEHPQEAAKMAVEKGYIGGTVELNAKLIDDYTWTSSNKKILDASVTEIWHQIDRAGALEDAPADKDAYIAKLSQDMVQYMGN